MPRKAKLKTQYHMVRKGDGFARVTLTPPNGKRKSWYAYWQGMVTSISTRQSTFDAAILDVESRLLGSDSRPDAAPEILTDGEFEAQQRAHFAKKKNQRAATATLKSVLEAMSALKLVTRLANIAAATPDDCAKFQIKAIELPKNWRHPQRVLNPDRPANEQIERLSPSTIVKMSRELQAAFERCNRNAPRRKCVRGVVPEKKLLNANPWHMFQWIEARERPVRQFSPQELLAMLDFMESRWREATAGIAAFKTLLWSWCRITEITELTWDRYRCFDNEHHFETIGKREVKKWFRVPDVLFRQLQELRSTDSSLVFARHAVQLRDVHSEQPNWLQNVKAFDPERFEAWLYDRVSSWSEKHGEPAYPHIFRKTAMQYARTGEDINEAVARDLHVSKSVMVASYTRQTDAVLRAESNRTYERLIAGMPQDVTRRYGCAPPAATDLKDQLRQATNAEDWSGVELILAALKQRAAKNPALSTQVPAGEGES